MLTNLIGAALAIVIWFVSSRGASTPQEQTGTVLFSIIAFLLWKVVTWGWKPLSFSPTPPPTKKEEKREKPIVLVPEGPLKAPPVFRIFVAIVLALLIGAVAIFIFNSSTVPTSEEGWNIVQATTGLNRSKPQLPEQMEGYFKTSIKTILPELSESTNSAYAKQFTDLVLKNQTAAFQKGWAEMVNKGSLSIAESRKNVVTVTFLPIIAVNIMQIVCAIAAIWMTWKFWGIFKLTPTFVFIGVTVYLYTAFFVSPVFGSTAQNLFWMGAGLSLIESLLSVSGALFSAWETLYEAPAGRLGFWIGIGLLLLGVAIGFSWDSYMQLKILTDAVIDSKYLMSFDQAQLFYQMGRLASTAGVVSIYSTLSKAAKAAPWQALEEKERRRQLPPHNP